ncbi:MAG: Rpn family recombination-promoting nuclease/putative transposase, partial [Leptospiraceae bacterium]|nr:Rpn family recombination-promoting nuclease/putative transposase [Leptospiraceae bacterium]
MQTLPIYNDLVFKMLFSRDPIILIDLLNSFPEFQRQKKIKKIKILNPILLPKRKNLKNTILDIHAEDINGNKFLIEMQSRAHDGFMERILFNWAKLFSSTLTQGVEYSELPKVYSINFLNFSLAKEYPEYYFNFSILENSHPEIRLTESLSIVIIEL